MYRFGASIWSPEIKKKSGVQGQGHPSPRNTIFRLSVTGTEPKLSFLPLSNTVILTPHFSNFPTKLFFPPAAFSGR